MVSLCMGHSVQSRALGGKVTQPPPPPGVQNRGVVPHWFIQRPRRESVTCQALGCPAGEGVMRLEADPGYCQQLWKKVTPRTRPCKKCKALPWGSYSPCFVWQIVTTCH